MKRYRIAVDIGGTFVDAIAFDRVTGEVRLEKASTTPRQASQGVIEALSKLEIELSECDFFIHGTTLGLNAILERKGAVTGILTNEGFRDIFEIGRGDVPSDHMYDFRYERPPLLVKRRHTAGVPGRIDVHGTVTRELDEPALLQAARDLVKKGVQSLAVCFLHSSKNATHERRAAELLRKTLPQCTVSISSEITREYREYERTATTVLEAYIRPIFEAYVEELEAALKKRGFQGQFLIMRSSGGAMTSELAKISPVFTVLSGPAGGIVGATFLSGLLRRDKVLSLDFGGTSLDASVIEGGHPLVMHEASLEHYPLLIPIFDIRCIGAGGGSIGWVQEGLLKVGPQSAGADPGPIAYGRGGTEPTTTDAALALGYLDPGAFLKGEMKLDIAAAQAGITERIADALGIDLLSAAAGIFDVMVAKTVGAIREITVERGNDPREFTLLAFGGAGPMIAPLLAREMQIGEMIVPQAPAAFSAWGMLMSDLSWDFSQTDVRLLSETPPDSLEQTYAKLESDAAQVLARQGVEPERRLLQRSMDLRYLGQEHTLEVPLGKDLSRKSIRGLFERLHETRYGHLTPDPVQIVTYRLRAVGTMEKPHLPRQEPVEGEAGGALRGSRQAFCFALRRLTEFRVYARDRLHCGQQLQGPAIVEEGTSTTVIHSDQSLRIDPYGHLVITTGESA